MIIKAGFTYAKSLTLKEQFHHSIKIYKYIINLTQLGIKSYLEILHEEKLAHHHTQHKLEKFVRLLVMALISLSYCYEQVLDLNRMVLTIKVARDVSKHFFQYNDEFNIYLRKIVKLTNRKYAHVYNSLKEMRKLIMMKFKEFACYDYHQD